MVLSRDMHLLRTRPDSGSKSGMTLRTLQTFWSVPALSKVNSISSPYQVLLHFLALQFSYTWISFSFNSKQESPATSEALKGLGNKKSIRTGSALRALPTLKCLRFYLSQKGKLHRPCWGPTCSILFDPCLN